MRRSVLLALLLMPAVASWSIAAKKKKKEEETQVLQLPKELPSTVTAETRHLAFHVTPLSAKGLLSQQTRNALKAVARSTGRGTVVKLRAFVAGSGDLRRVRDLVSETFTDRKQPLPALSLVLVGALPLEGAQLVLESISAVRKEVNPQGLAWIAGQGAFSTQPLEPVRPLADKAFANLATAVKAAGSEPADVLRVTCFLSALDQLSGIRGMFQQAYPGAALDFVQMQRAPLHAGAECEAVARLRAAPGAKVRFLNPEGLAKSPNFSQVALVAAPHVILTGTQNSFGYQDADARLAFQRLDSSVEQAGGSLKDVAFSSLYPLSDSLAAQVRKVRFEFFDKSRPPAATMVPFEGLPSMDSGFAVDVVAVKD